MTHLKCHYVMISNTKVWPNSDQCLTCKTSTSWKPRGLPSSAQHPFLPCWIWLCPKWTLVSWQRSIRCKVCSLLHSPPLHSCKSWNEWWHLLCLNWHNYSILWRYVINLRLGLIAIYIFVKVLIIVK